MGKPKYDYPVPSFPYKISHRLNVMSLPIPKYDIFEENTFRVTPNGVRKNAIDGKIINLERINDIALPYAKTLLMLKRQYKRHFDEKRLAIIRKMIEQSNATMYTKLANAIIDLKKMDIKKSKKWTDNDWKKHMDYISKISQPKRFTVPPEETVTKVPLSQLMPRLIELSTVAPIKMYRRYSQESGYKDPLKVRKSALTYQITPRVKELAKPKAYEVAG